MSKLYNSIVTNLVEKIDLSMVALVTATLVIGIFLLNIIKLIVNRTVLNKSNKQTKMLINKLVSYTGFSILFIIILGEIGIELSTLLGAAGVMGIAIGIASQKSLGNIISGFFMVTEKSFEIGDVITVGDKTGTVYSVELLSIMLKTFDNRLIRIPNESLISTDITNITRFPIRRLDLDILVAYKTDLQKVASILERIAIDNPILLDEPKYYFQIKNFEDSGILIVFGVWFEKENFLAVKNSLMNDILIKFRENSIEIPYNHIVIKKESDNI